jgi:transcriptional regulator with XRE-family HTH domain
MMITGKIAKQEGVWWSAEAPIAGVYTQGKSRKDAMVMLGLAFEDLINRPAFKVKVTEHGPGGEVLVEANEPAVLVAHVLKYQRETHGLSLADVQKALGESSRTTYARYERGQVVPSLQKLIDALRAVAPELGVVIEERAAVSIDIGRSEPIAVAPAPPRKPARGRRAAKDEIGGRIKGRG